MQICLPIYRLASRTYITPPNGMTTRLHDIHSSDDIIVFVQFFCTACPNITFFHLQIASFIFLIGYYLDHVLYQLGVL